MFDFAMKCQVRSHCFVNERRYELFNILHVFVKVPISSRKIVLKYAPMVLKQCPIHFKAFNLLWSKNHQNIFGLIVWFIQKSFPSRKWYLDLITTENDVKSIFFPELCKEMGTKNFALFFNCEWRLFLCDKFLCVYKLRDEIAKDYFEITYVWCNWTTWSTSSSND